MSCASDFSGRPEKFQGPFARAWILPKQSGISLVIQSIRFAFRRNEVRYSPNWFARDDALYACLIMNLNYVTQVRLCRIQRVDDSPSHRDE